MERRRRIAVVDIGYEYTGATTYVCNLFTLISGDADIWLVTLSSLLTTAALRNEVRVVDLSFAAKWVRPMQIPLCMLVLVWLRVRYRLDIVWVNGYPEIVFMPLARLIGCRAVATRHLTLLTNKPSFYWLRNGWRVHFLYELLARTANKIVCVSATVAESMKAYVREEKLAVIPNWVPALPELVSVAHDKSALRLLFVGRLVKLKGLDILLDAIRCFETKGQNISLIVVGEGEERAKWEKAAAQLNVEFVGFRSDVETFYTSADVFVNPTRGPEGLPLVTLDAMSYGLPCILSDLPVHREITGDGESALLFESGNPDDLRKRIELLVKDSSRLAEFGRMARSAVESRHRADIARKLYVDELGL